MILEACVETVQQAIAAEQNGATQIELCSHLNLDGLTPPISLVEQVLEKINIPVKVMIRPENNFRYSVRVLNRMLDKIKDFQDFAIAGFVFGLLDEHRSVHMNSTRELCQAAGSIPCTFHKAIDATADPCAAALQLTSISNLKSILSSGGAATAVEGLIVLDQMQAACPRLQIIAAGSITYENLPDLLSKTMLQSFHGRRIVQGIT